MARSSMCGGASMSPGATGASPRSITRASGYLAFSTSPSPTATMRPSPSQTIACATAWSGSEVWILPACSRVWAPAARGTNTAAQSKDSTVLRSMGGASDGQWPPMLQRAAADAPRGRRAPGLLGAHVHPHADAVAGVVAGAGGVLPPRVFVGDVVTVDAAVVDITAVGVVTVAAVRDLLADGDVGIALAPVGLVDATPGHAADHRTHRGTDVLPAAVADLAAEYRAGNAADHGGDQTAVVVAPRLPVRVGVAVVTAAAIAVITIAVRIGAIGIGGDIAVATGLALALPVHGPGAAVEDRIHPHHARPVVAVVGIAVARADRIGTAQTVSVIALASRAMAVIAVGRGTVAVVVGLRGG